MWSRPAPRERARAQRCGHARTARDPRTKGLRWGREGGSDLLSPPPQQPVREIRPAIRSPPSPEHSREVGHRGPGEGAGAAQAGPRALGAPPSGPLPQPLARPARRTPAGPRAAHELVRPRVPHELFPLLNHLPAALLLFLDDHLGGGRPVPRGAGGYGEAGVRRAETVPTRTGTRQEQRQPGRGRPLSDMQLLQIPRCTATRCGLLAARRGMQRS